MQWGGGGRRVSVQQGAGPGQDGAALQPLPSRLSCLPLQPAQHHVHHAQAAVNHKL
jgi:hypothetical protein